MSGPGQAKRKRTGTISATNSGPINSKVVWVDDGNIVLEAESTRFRVHRSMLSSQSTVFADMFMLPQPQNDPNFEGCPIIHLSDSASDAECFLRALYNGSWYYGTQLQTISIIAAILRMSRKYDCQLLRKDALTRLTVEYPSALTDWDANRHITPTRILFEDSLPIDVIITAVENSLDRVLPAAFLACMEHLTLEEILVGVKRDDGTTAILPPELQKTCIIGQERFNGALTEHLDKWIVESPVKCSKEPICVGFQGLLLLSIFYPEPRSTCGLMAWGEWGPSQNDVVSKMCQRCNRDGESAQEVIRNKLWESLPSFFGLSRWDELENE